MLDILSGASNLATLADILKTRRAQEKREQKTAAGLMTFTVKKTGVSEETITVTNEGSREEMYDITVSDLFDSPGGGASLKRVLLARARVMRPASELRITVNTPRPTLPQVSFRDRHGAWWVVEFKPATQTGETRLLSAEGPADFDMTSDRYNAAWRGDDEHLKDFTALTATAEQHPIDR